MRQKLTLKLPMKWVDLQDKTTPLAPLTREIVMPWVQQFLAESTMH